MILYKFDDKKIRWKPVLIQKFIKMATNWFYSIIKNLDLAGKF